MSNLVQGTIPLPSGVADPARTFGGTGKIIKKYPYTMTMRSPLLDPPDGSWPFLPNGKAIMPAIGDKATICSQVVPANRVGAINRLANGTGLGTGIDNWINGDGNLVWQVYRNGSPYQYLGKIVVIFGLVELGGAPLDSPLRIRANDVISLVVTNLGVNPEGQILIGLLNGYTYPQEQEPSTSR
jgi:hypothetical protein